MAGNPEEEVRTEGQEACPNNDVVEFGDMRPPPASHVTVLWVQDRSGFIVGGRRSVQDSRFNSKKDKILPEVPAPQT